MSTSSANSRNPLALWLALIVLASGCAKGIDPPSATPVVDLASGTFTMGEAAADPCGEMRVGRNGPILPGRLEQQAARVLHDVTVDRFCLDATEVTVEQYRHCVAREACGAPEATNAGNQGTPGFVPRYYGDDTGYDQHPVMGVNWSQAAAYCAFRGGRLPTEVEWAYAARSRGERQTIWADDSLADVVETGCEMTALAGTIALGSCATGPQPVGISTQDVTAEGVFDMAGNAAEWVADEFDPLAYCAPTQGDLSLSELFVLDGTLFVPRVGPTLLSEAGCLAVDEATARYVGPPVEAFGACKESCRVGFGNALALSAQVAQWRAHTCANAVDLAQGDVDAFPPCGGEECGTVDGCVEYCGCLDDVTPPDDGHDCVVQCLDRFETDAAACVVDGVTFACVPLEQNANCDPVPWCLPRTETTGAHVAVPAHLAPTQQGAHVVRGGHFQSTAACEARPSARRGEVVSTPLVGFRCAYDLGTPRCPQ